jgi:cell wall-associated NlpC family hydrolase
MSLDLRRKVVDEARSWLLTPYHHQAMVKGAGCDCVTLLIAVYRTVGVVAFDFSAGNYDGEWFLHRSEEIYLQGVAKHAHQVDEPQIGDVALYRLGRTVSHGVIIVETKPELYGIHASRPARNVEMIELRALEDKFHSYWSPFE